MGILVSSAPSQPALTFDRLQVDAYVVRVARKAPYAYRVEMSMDYYALDGSGNRVYANQSFVLSSQDFNVDFAQWAIANGYATDEADVQSKVQQAESEVNTEYSNGTIDPFKLMAYFKLGIGFQVKIKQTNDLAGLG